jgi:hypothetical protein
MTVSTGSDGHNNVMINPKTAMSALPQAAGLAINKGHKTSYYPF